MKEMEPKMLQQMGFFVSKDALQKETNKKKSTKSKKN